MEMAYCKTPLNDTHKQRTTFLQKLQNKKLEFSSGVLLQAVKHFSFQIHNRLYDTSLFNPNKILIALVIYTQTLNANLALVRITLKPRRKLGNQISNPK